jgi:hypothetical protein
MPIRHEVDSITSERMDYSGLTDCSRAISAKSPNLPHYVGICSSPPLFTKPSQRGKKQTLLVARRPSSLGFGLQDDEAKLVGIERACCRDGKMSGNDYAVPGRY